jgi:hypothetical protein
MIDSRAQAEVQAAADELVVTAHLSNGEMA